MIIFLNGFGLVAIPRRVFYYSNRGLKIKKLEFSAARLSDEKDEIEETLKECAGKVVSLKENLNINYDAEIEKRVQIMWETISNTDEIFKTVKPSKDQQDYAKGVKLEKLSNLNYKLKKSCHEYKRANK